MPITSTTTDYTDRLIDVHIFQGVDPHTRTTINPSFGKVSNYCTGIQKLIQRYAISLFNELGSQPTFPEFGTTFVRDISYVNSNLVSYHSLVNAFNISNLKVIKEFREYQRNNEQPEDEQLSTASLEAVDVQGGYVHLAIRVIPVSGNNTQFVLPIPIVN